MTCCVSNHRAGNEDRCCCCSRQTAWTITALAGAAILAFGVIAVLSLVKPNLGQIRQWMQIAGKGIGTSPFVLPVLITSIGGTILLAAIISHTYNRCTKETGTHA